MIKTACESTCLELCVGDVAVAVPVGDPEDLLGLRLGDVVRQVGHHHLELLEGEELLVHVVQVGRLRRGPLGADEGAVELLVARLPDGKI